VIPRRVVVTGMGAVTPIGIGLTAFTEGLRAGRSGARPIQNFDGATFPNRLGCEVDDQDLYAHHGHIDEASRAWLLSDKKAFMAAVAADMAIIDAGVNLVRIPSVQRGIAFGPGIDYVDFSRSLSSVPDPQGALPLHDAFWRVRGDDHQPTRLPFDGPALWAARRYGFGGLRITNIGACAAGAMAIGEGFQMVRRGLATAVLTGGFDSMISPLGVMGFSILGALSSRHNDPTRASRPFDVGRDGFVPGEGAGMLVLEELEHALARKAHIYGEVVGYGASLDAYRPTAPEPGARGAALAMRKALAMAGWAPERVQYINAHGTSTPLNDKTETLAIKLVLGKHAYDIPVSSTKSQIGHLVAGAGAVELVGCLLAMNADFVPATINLDNPDPDCDLDYVPNHPRAQSFNTCLSNSFAFGGQNACIAIQKWEAS
jgi:3-oxoacyl-[acyl-carrier-protein] synthase II